MWMEGMRGGRQCRVDIGNRGGRSPNPPTGPPAQVPAGQDSGRGAYGAKPAENLPRGHEAAGGPGKVDASLPRV